MSPPKQSVSGGPGGSEGEVEGLVDAECLALGVGALELLLAEGGTHLAEAVLAVAGFGLLPGFTGPVQKDLGDTVQLPGPVPVARVGGEACQAKAGVGQT